MTKSSRIHDSTLRGKGVGSGRALDKNENSAIISSINAEAPSDLGTLHVSSRWYARKPVYNRWRWLGLGLRGMVNADTSRVLGWARLDVAGELKHPEFGAAAHHLVIHMCSDSI